MEEEACVLDRVNGRVVRQGRKGDAFPRQVAKTVQLIILMDVDITIEVTETPVGGCFKGGVEIERTILGKNQIVEHGHAHAPDRNLVRRVVDSHKIGPPKLYC